MVRTFVVREKMNLETLSSNLLDARFRGTQAEAAVSDLKRFNPHLDLEKLTPGTVVLVPDNPGFKVSATDSTQSTPLEDFRKQASTALNDATSRLKTGFETRRAERAEISAFLKSAVFKRLTAGDELLVKQAEEANAALAAEEEQDKKALESFDATAKSALAALGQFSKILG